MNRKTVGSIIFFIGVLTIVGKFFFSHLVHYSVLSWGGLVLAILGAALVSEKKN
ncbi:hypothetical protein JFL43_19695 [Viridibacillus sp. YIM B01967]|uniref:Uncharacterized protein n=1 Tax=Viridibacillus soli TaxID=2798301 RepID=A0ABS1HCA6_9BACL|nr:hypothetical protein [Viridibacillus soli]MBK3497021.1 hypothetical protein [Viridibacillus soli]